MINARAWEIVRVGEWMKRIREAKMRRGVEIEREKEKGQGGRGAKIE